MYLSRRKITCRLIGSYSTETIHSRIADGKKWTCLIVHDNKHSFKIITVCRIRAQLVEWILTKELQVGVIRSLQRTRASLGTVSFSKNDKRCAALDCKEDREGTQVLYNKGSTNAVDTEVLEVSSHYVH